MAESDPSTPERLRALQSRWDSDKTSRVFVQLAEEYRRVGRTEEALAILAEGLTSNPNYLAAKVVQGRCHLDLGRAKDAIRELEGVIARDPTQMVAYKLLVEAHLVEGDGEEARKRLRIYSLLNDSDPEIAELRRRIGELGRKHRDPEDTFVGALRPEPAPAPAPEAPVAVEPAAPPAPRPFTLDDFDRPESEVVAAEPVAAEPPVETAAVFDELPFPELTLEPQRYRAALPPEPIFDLSPQAWPSAPAPAAALTPPAEDIPWRLEEAESEAPLQFEEPVVTAPPAATAFELFDLDSAPGPADLDVTGLLGRVSTPPEPAATVTLGLLYLRQGHLAEAEAMFHEVLAREPGNFAAQGGLAEIAITRRAALVTQAPADLDVQPAFPLETEPLTEVEAEVELPAPPPPFTPAPEAARPVAFTAFDSDLEPEPVLTAEEEPLTAASLLVGFEPTRDGEGPEAQKRYLLRGYLARLRGARGSHVR